MIRTSALIFSTLCLFAAPAFAGGEEAEAPQALEFQMPSHNVGCVFIPEGGTGTYVPANGHAELQCDRISPSYVRVILGSSGKARKITNVGDASCCGGDVLPYGELWTAGPFTCVSAASGLTCTRGKHGLVINKKSVKAF